MHILKKTVFTIAATSILAFPSVAHANSPSHGGNVSNGSHSAGSVSSFLPGGSGGYTGFNSFYNVLDGSETASRYFRKGLKNFEKGNLEKSEYAFRGVLRAQGSKNLYGLSFYYLAQISERQGDEVQQKKYEEAYYAFLEGGETATSFYKAGVANFKKGDLVKSETAFEASLGAQGSKALDALALHYLTLISDKQGDEAKKEQYAKAYFDLIEN